MCIYVFLETDNKQVRQASLHALCYGRAYAEARGSKEVHAIAIGAIEDTHTSGHTSGHTLGTYGATEVSCIGEADAPPSAAAQAAALATALPQTGDFTLIMATGHEQVAARIAMQCEAALATGILALPEENQAGCVVRRGIYTGKAFESLQLKGRRRVLCVQKNAAPLRECSEAATPTPQQQPLAPYEGVQPTFLEQHKSTQAVPLPEADIVVSGGRGMKGPENWHLIEDLARSLGAAMACSKPVSDMEWRPHHEHVGQTGIKVAPSLYIAIGISGAVQHLAGVNNSKVIVVLNKDSEAPFFQAADYGIVGDALEVLPQLIAAIKKTQN